MPTLKISECPSFLSFCLIPSPRFWPSVYVGTANPKRMPTSTNSPFHSTPSHHHSLPPPSLMESLSTATAMQDRFGCCFRNWMAQQHRDLDELLLAVSTHSGDADKLKSLAGKNIQHFRDYLEARSQLAQHDAPSFFCPSWCTSFENSFLWIGGCRPTLAIRLVYSISGSELEARVAGGGTGGDDNSNGISLGDISASQLRSINELHMKTVRMEEKLSSRMASMQEEIADDPLALIAKRRGRAGEESESVERVMKGHALSLAGLLTEADELRLATLRELVEEILTPLQAVELLVDMKKLHLSIHEWGQRRDSVLGKV